LFGCGLDSIGKRLDHSPATVQCLARRFWIRLTETGTDSGYFLENVGRMLPKKRIDLSLIIVKYAFCGAAER
jgi:hypothetical protein